MAHHPVALAAASLAIMFGPLATIQAADDDDAATRIGKAARATTIHRDEWGVAHVTAGTDAHAVFGFMYARAEDELYAIERSLLTMTAQGAAAFGEVGLAGDILMHAFEVPERAQAEYAAAPKHVRALCAAVEANTQRSSHRGE